MQIEQESPYNSVEDFPVQSIGKQSKAPLLKSPKNVNLGKILCGLSFGFNAACAIKYFLHEYLEQNPKLSLPIVGISTALGGFAGYLFSKI